MRIYRQAGTRAISEIERTLKSLDRSHVDTHDAKVWVGERGGVITVCAL